MWFVSPLLSFPGNYMMINEAAFYQSNATLAQNINQLFSPRHFTVILLSQKLFANCNRTFSQPARHFRRILFANDLSENVFATISKLALSH